MRGEAGAAEYFQHLYMGLGRAQRLDRVMIRNFPRADDGDLDGSILESGPPDYLIEFFHVLEKLAKRTMPRLLKAQRDLCMPTWENCPECQPDTTKRGRYIYDPVAWGRKPITQVSTSAKRGRDGTVRC